MTEINVPLLRKTLEHITAHPEEWNQRMWARVTDCGTACCVAGWAVQFAGHQLGEPECECGTCSDVSHLDDGRRISDVAADVLGLDPSGNACDLFSPSNTLADIWQYASDFTDGEIEIPSEVK